MSCNNSELFCLTPLASNNQLIRSSLERYFRTFTPFGLFREPQFSTKIAGIQSELQLTALLAAMIALAAKTTHDSEHKSATHFADLAIISVDGAFAQCADDVSSSLPSPGPDLGDALVDFEGCPWKIVEVSRSLHSRGVRTGSSLDGRWQRPGNVHRGHKSLV